ncbi:C39 family peptidase [Nonomuraea sp. NPDC050786]|uniref:C39 family peptidase n=1 Tax=Nonomuraea sp. NPDC050786 TaxID=3154840 RepID=UPI0033EB51F8
MKKPGPATGTALALAATVGALCLTPLSPAYASPGVPAGSPVADPQSDQLVRPLKYQLSLDAQRQQTNYFCVPASSSMSLASFGIMVNQATLAKKMKTAPPYGTEGVDAVPVINTYINFLGYKVTMPTDADGNPAVLMKRVAKDIGELHRAPVLTVWMDQLPWNKGKVKGHRIGHAILAYGYDKSARTITVYDPWKPTGGTHVISASALADVLQPAGNMYYVSKL